MNDAACPSENTLVDFVSGRSTDAASVRGHLLTCSACQDLVGELARGQTVAGEAPVLQRGDSVGRYLVLGVLGSGAMGVVYDAYDPELARKVALKLVRTEGGNADQRRARLLREGQAMARLEHPHVVRVYDVGRFGEQVFVTMEQATGGTLTAWLHAAPRTRDEVLTRFLEAGRGLEAAHRAGLVHRDFKPDNVLLGADGRARVTDFGLARWDASETKADAVPASADLAVTRTGAMVGTPAYMAPEQLAGQPSDARADVYAFSVSLFEGLTGRRPFTAGSIEALQRSIAAGQLPDEARRLPAKLRSILQKGLATDPSARWPSMTALLDALDPKPSRRWQSLLVAAVVFLAAGGSVLAARSNRVSCDRATEAWGQTWNGETRTAVEAALRQTGLGFAAQAFQGTAQALDARREAWLTMHVRACEATHVQHTQTEALLDKRMACLEERRLETEALVALLRHADADLVERATDAVEHLSRLDDCANPLALGEAPPLTGEALIASREAQALMAQAEAQWAAGRYQKCSELDAQAIARARAADAQSLGRVLVSAARCADEEMKYDDAEALAHESVRVALQQHDDAVLTDAFFRLSGVATYRRGDLVRGQLWLSYAESTLQRLGFDRARLARLYERRSLIEWSRLGDPEAAERDYERSLALLAGRTIDDAKAFFPAHGGAQVDMGHYDLALEMYRRGVERITREKGPEHPELLEDTENYAELLALTGKPEAALPLLEDLVKRFPDRAQGYTTHRLAFVLRALNRPAEALQWDEVALAHPESEDPQSDLLAPPLLGKGLDLVMLHRAAEAVPLLERAVALRKPGHLEAPVGEVKFGLARGLWDVGQRDRALALASEAQAAYAHDAQRWGSPYFAATAEEIAEWQKERRP